MIAALLLYLKWTLEARHGKVATSQVPKWFKLVAHSRSMDAYWDPKEECMCNKSDEMLLAALSNLDALYWEVEVEQVILERKKIKVDKESVSDSISTVKMVISSIPTHQPQQSTTSKAKGHTSKMVTTVDAKTVNSQTLTIMQLMEQVSILQLMHNEINSKLDKLTKFIMAQAAKPTTPTILKHKAAGGD